MKDYAAELVGNLQWLRKMACRYCKEDADIEDLVSDTVTRLWQARGSYKEGHAFRSLAYKVMQNIYINQFNRQKCVRFVEQFPKNEPSTRIHADTLISQKQIVEAVRRASKWSVCIRPVIMYALGYSYQEIADILSIPMGTVQRRIHEGRRILKQELQP